MSKRDKNKNNSKDQIKLPYFLNMEVDKSRLDKVPEETPAAELFINTCLAAIISVSKLRSGISMNEQRRFYSLRNIFDNAVKCNEIYSVEIPYDDFKFLRKCWEEQSSLATVNEILMLVEDKLKIAELEHKKSEIKE